VEKLMILFPAATSELSMTGDVERSRVCLTPVLPIYDAWMFMDACGKELERYSSGCVGFRGKQKWGKN
jgi:hypothetical protein